MIICLRGSNTSENHFRRAKSTPPLQPIYGQNSIPLWGGTCLVYSLYRGLAYPPEGIA